MYKFTKTDRVDLEEYEAYLKTNKYLYYDRTATALQMEYMRCVSGAENQRATDIAFKRSGGTILELGRESVYHYLTRFENCPDHYFGSKNSQSDFSLDKKRVLEKLYANGYAREFLDSYMLSRSLKSKVGGVASIVNACTVEACKASDGRTLCRIPYDVNPQKNLRFNYNSFDIISQIPKEFCHNICAPDGYFLVWGDFAQSDFRIAYNVLLRSRENDEVMRKYQDKYEALARLVAKTNGLEFDEDEFKRDRVLYKTLTLATIYGMSDSVVQRESEFIHNLQRFLDTCPKYTEYKRRIQQRKELGLPITVQSYFGYEDTVAVTCGGGSEIEHDLLNRPIQSGTSEIVILTVNHLLHTFYSLGYTEEDFSVYYVRHDEPIFLVKKTALKDMWVFKQFTQLLIDDWIPLQLDFKYGYAYTIPDEELEQKVVDVCGKNLDKIDFYASGETVDTDYYPISPALFIYMHAIQVEAGGFTVVSFHDAVQNAYTVMKIDSLDNDEIFEAIRARLNACEKKIFDVGYRGICVISNFYECEDFFGASYVRFKMEQGVQLNTASKLCRCFVNKLCTQLGLECPVEPVNENDLQMISEMKALEVLA